MDRQREELLKSVASLIVKLPRTGVVKVAIDGVDGAGKTTFADELVPHIEALDRAVIRASVDGFHNKREVRYNRGRTSSEGFFLDSYNYSLLREALLDPLTSGEAGKYRVKAFDHVTDSFVQSEPYQALPNSILLFDGIFLHRPELLGYWDFSIFLEVDFNVSIPRGGQRGPGFGSPDPGAESNRRYVDGQKLYFDRCHPKKNATIVIDNNDLRAPRIR